MKRLVLLLSLAACTHTAPLREPVAQLVSPTSTSTHIVFDSEVNGLTVAVFVQELGQRISTGEKAVVVEIDTPGGSVSAGMEMAKAIERAPVPVVCVVDGLGASMGLYILQSCDVRVMTRRSLLMGHAPSTKMAGQADDFIQVAELMTRLSRAMANHITRRTKLSTDDYLAKIAEGRELWLTSDEAVHFAFVDFAADTVAEVVKGAQLIQ